MTTTLRMSEREVGIVRSALKVWRSEQTHNLILTVEIDGLLARLESPTPLKVAADMGRIGGRAKVSKGFATLDEATRSANAKRAAAKRWSKKGRSK